LIKNQSIKTTLARAKAARTLAEKTISLAKDGTLASKRVAFEILGDHKLVSYLFNDIGARFKDRTGGYTRIIQLGLRRGDNAKLVIWELTEIKKIDKPKKATKAKEAAVKTEPHEASQSRTEEDKGHKADVAVKEKPPVEKKPAKKFLGGIKNIFKKERDSL
jgi:large subunit ribosomal protein L17